MFHFPLQVLEISEHDGQPWVPHLFLLLGGTWFSAQFLCFFPLVFACLCPVSSQPLWRSVVCISMAQKDWLPGSLLKFQTQFLKLLSIMIFWGLSWALLHYLVSLKSQLPHLCWPELLQTVAFGVPAMTQRVKNLTAAALVAVEVRVWPPAQHSRLKNLVLPYLQSRSQLWLRCSPWPGNFHIWLVCP